MNKDEIIPDHIQMTYKPDYKVFFFFTGQKPNEMGYMLLQDKKVLKKVVMGTLTDGEKIDEVWTDVEEYLKDKDLTMKVIREVKWVNPHFFTL
jgi:hypothetical protein